MTTNALDCTTLTPSKVLPVLHAHQLDEVEQPQRWLIDQLWAKSGVGFIGGIPKTGKSWTGLELACAVGTGTSAFGRFNVVEPGPALIYLAEDALHAVRERLVHLAQARKRTLKELDVRVITAPAIRLDLPQDRERLFNTVRLHQPRLLLLDPFVRLHRIDENQAQEVAPLLDSLRQLQRECGTAIIIVHHIRKSGAVKPGQALRGSGDLHAWSDSSLYLTPHQDGIRMTVEQRSAKACEPIFLRLKDNPLHLAIDRCGGPTPPRDESLSLEDRLLAVLTHAREPISRTTLRQTLKVNNQKLGEALARLQQQKRLLHSQKGWTALSS